MKARLAIMGALLLATAMSVALFVALARAGR
jgi:hypothetical protein